MLLLLQIVKCVHSAIRLQQAHVDNHSDLTSVLPRHCGGLRERFELHCHQLAISAAAANQAAAAALVALAAALSAVALQQPPNPEAWVVCLAFFSKGVGACVTNIPKGD